MSNKVDINDPGQPGTLQRLIYRSVRATTPTEWRRLNDLAHSVLDARPRDQLDTVEGLLINALCAATHKITHG